MAVSSTTGSITSSGVGSGLDVDGLVTKLMSVESQVLTPLTTQASSYNSLLSAYGTVKSTISSFQSALNKYTQATFSAQKAAVNNGGSGDNLTTDAFTASVNTDTTTKSLGQRLQSSAVATGTTFKSGDSIAIKVGSGSPTFITLSSDQTLSGLKDLINKSDAGVTASITKDDQGDHLVIESNSTGTANKLQISSNGSLSMFGYNTSSTSPTTMTQIQAPRDETSAASGSYEVSVEQLAKAQKLKSSAITADQTFSSGILAIKVGTNSTTLITPENNTLSGVRDAINASDAGVSASIVKDGDNYHLVVTAKNTGASNTVKITGTEDFASLSYDPSNPSSTTGMNLSQAAQDAKVTIDGVAVTSSTNEISDAISGVTLNLSKVTTAGDSYTLDISNDKSAIQSSVSELVSSYNTMMKQLSSMTAYDADTKTAGALQGDASARSMITQIKQAMIQSVAGNSAIKTLSDIGVSLQKDGTYEVDSVKLNTAATDNFSGISNLLTSDNGIISKMKTLMDSFLDDDNGIVTQKTKSIQSSLDLNTKRQEEINTRLTNAKTRYTTLFNNLDLTLANLQSTQSYLTSALASLSSSSS